MNDTAMAMAAFHGQMKIITLAAIFASLASEGYALLDQPADRLAAGANDLPDGIFVT